MIKMTVACKTGMSANVLSRVLQEKADQKGIDVKITGCGIQQIEDKAHTCDVVIVGPQIGFNGKEIKEKLENKCAVITLDINDFNVNASEDVLNRALAAYK